MLKQARVLALLITSTSLISACSSDAGQGPSPGVASATTSSATKGRETDGFRGTVQTGTTFRYAGTPIRLLEESANDPTRVDLAFTSQGLGSGCTSDGLVNEPCRGLGEATMRWDVIPLLDLTAGTVQTDHEQVVHEVDRSSRLTSIGLTIPELSPGLHCLVVALAETGAAVEDRGYTDHSVVAVLPIQVGGSSQPRRCTLPLARDTVTAPSDGSLVCGPFARLAEHASDALPGFSMTLSAVSCDFDQFVAVLVDGRIVSSGRLAGSKDPSTIRVGIDVPRGAVVRAVVVPAPAVDVHPQHDTYAYVARPNRMGS